jgi:Protein of unknown function (DUF3108)
MRLLLKRYLGIVVRVSGIAAGRSKITLAVLLAFLPCASAESLVSRYAVSLSGIRIGDATLNTDLTAKRYKVQVSATFGVLFFSTQMQGHASGARTGAKLTPEHFQMLSSGDDPDRMEVDFSKPAKAAHDRVAQLRGFFDPLSALLNASYKPRSRSSHPCTALLPIFTGHDIYFLELQPAPAGPEPTEPGLTLCQANLFQSVAGGTKLRRFNNWRIAFTQSATPHFWLVQRVSLPTQYGTLTIERTETSMSAR